jgi:hypothetical protein
MAESISPNSTDVAMDQRSPSTMDVDSAPPTVASPSIPAGPSTPTFESNVASTSYIAPKEVTPCEGQEDDDDGHPPPAKRARKHSNADRASLTNVGFHFFHISSRLLISTCLSVLPNSRQLRLQSLLQLPCFRMVPRLQPRLQPHQRLVWLNSVSASPPFAR